MAPLRLDKYLAQSGERSRKEAAQLLRSGAVQVDGVLERDPACKVDPDRQTITLQGEMVEDRALQYYLLHKPAGFLTAAQDHRAQTVMDLLPETLSKRKVLPVGRLDKDATGLLLLTNDGKLAHGLLAPKSHVLKEYHVRVEGRLEESDTLAFGAGLALSDFTAKPSRMKIESACDAYSDAVVWLSEGKFHQVKRMFGARGHTVVRLCRAAFGPLRLTPDLPEGAYRELTAQEVESLRDALKKG